MTKVARVLLFVEVVMRFFDPHSGRGGAAAPLPEKVRKYAAKLDGKREGVRVVVAKIRSMLGRNYSVKSHKGAIQLTYGSFAAEWSGSGRPVHCWRVIKYKR